MSVKTKQLTTHNYLRDYILCIGPVIHNKTLEVAPSPCHIYICSVTFLLTSTCLVELGNTVGLLFIKASGRKQPLKDLAAWSKHQRTWGKRRKVRTYCMSKYFEVIILLMSIVSFSTQASRDWCLLRSLTSQRLREPRTIVLIWCKLGSGLGTRIPVLLKLGWRIIRISRKLSQAGDSLPNTWVLWHGISWWPSMPPNLRREEKGTILF